MNKIVPTIFAPPETAKLLNKAISDSPTQLYRHFDAEGRLLYVGISLAALTRLAQHKERSHWFAAIATVTIETFATREDAIQAETLAIQTEAPRFNIKMAQGADEDPDASRLGISRSQILAQIVSLNPVYTDMEAADLLRTNPSAIRRLIKEGKIGSISIGRKTLITGWQILEFLDYAAVTGQPG
ncbi:MAG: helix-turn-helix domain-containing protein [Hyphomicrobiales bacterium]|nr:helix-turn-helix domain-containing protein [Hyphomicrobiales bacterium]